MDSSLFLSQPKIKVEDDVSDVINLDEDKTPEDLVYEWHSKVCMKIKDNFIVESEGSLDALMKWYIQLLKDEAVNLEDCQILKGLAAKHIQLFKLYFVELNCCFVDNYLDNMEEILTVYSSMEVKSVPKKRRDGNKRTYKKILSSVCRRIICMLNLYLLNREDRMYHVVMKIKLNSLSEESKELLNLLYGKLLTKEPKDKSDLGFCRSYILYQKWKTVRRPDEWEKMDEVMYKLYDRTPECVKTNETLKRILLPQNSSVLDTLLHITEKHIIISEEYFKFISSVKLQEENVILPEISDVEINDPILPDLVDDDEEEAFNKAYNSFVKSMSTLSQTKADAATNEDITVKAEDDEDDDCQIVAVSSVAYDSEETDLVHEILDDDDIEIIYFKKKEQQSSSQKDRAAISFLDSIEIPDPSDALPERVSSSSAPSTLVSQASVINLVTTSTSTSTLESPDTRALCLSARKSNALEITTTASNTENRTVPDPPSLLSSDVEVITTSMEVNSDSRPSLTKNIGDTEDSLEPSTDLGPVKTVTNTETQTDDFTQIINASNLGSCQCNKKDGDSPHTLEKQDSVCTGYYYYGLVTPPSDQPSDEHSTSTTNNNAYSNVYANIVRTRGTQSEADSIPKASENYYILPSTAESNSEDNTKCPSTSSELVNTVCFTQSLEEQGMRDVEDHGHFRNEDSNTSFEMEFEPSKEVGVKEQHVSVANSSEGEVNCLLHCNSLPEQIVTTQEPILDHNDQRAGDSRNQSLDEPLYNQDSNLVSESCPDQEVAERSLQQSTFHNETNVCGSSNTYNSISIPTTFIETVSTRSSSPSKRSDTFKTPSVSSNIPCTSTDIVVTSQGITSNIPSSNVEIELVKTPCPSPDITSTSTDFQDYNKKFSRQEDDFEENRAPYENLSSNVSDPEDLYLANNASYCSEEYVDYSACNISNEDCTNNENVSQSNLEDGEGGEEIFIEDPVLINNEEELSFIIGEALPIGANVNICIDNQCDESSVQSAISSPVNNSGRYEIEQSEVVKGIQKASGEISENSQSPLREIKVAIEKVNEHKTSNKVNTRKIMFTSSEKVQKSSTDDFSKFEETIQLRWNKLKETHNLDEIFSGPISKVNGVNNCVNPDANFDLFNCKPSVIYGEHLSQTPTNSSANSSGEVISPAYEGIDDFRSYYEENKNNSMLGISSPQKLPVEDKIMNSAVPTEKHHLKNNTDKTDTQLFPRDLKSLQNKEMGPHKITDDTVPTDVGDKEKSLKVKPQTNVKRMRIAFAENIIDSSNTVSHSPTENPVGVLQSILKKSSLGSENIRLNDKRITRPRIPRRLMNLKSLAQFNVKPNDPCIQGVPCVVIERLSDSEISQWLRVSEISRKIRLQKQQAQFASTQSIFRVDYDKQTSHINENDVVRYNTPEVISAFSIPQTGHWRSNPILHTKSSRLDEGMVASRPSSNFIDNDYNSIPTPCRNSCCNSLTTDLSNLNVSRTSVETILNLSCCNPCTSIKCCGSHFPKPNPFLLPTNMKKKTRRVKESGKSRPTCCDVAGLTKSPQNSNNSSLNASSEDLNVSVPPNLDFKGQTVSNANLDLIPINFDNEENLPSVVPDLADFEKDINIEELTRELSIPSDLYNLNLRKFSPSPVMNCLSPQSESPNHMFHSETFSGQNASLRAENPSLKIHYIHDDIPNFVNTTNNFNNEKLETDTPTNLEFPNLKHPQYLEKYSSLKFENVCKSEIENRSSIKQLNEFVTNKKSKETRIVIPDRREGINSEILTKIDADLLESDAETRLPLKKRKLSVASTKEEVADEDFIGPDLVEEIIKRARAEKVDKDDISYPAKPMISIAEIQEKLVEPHPRVFKTPAEKKEMPPAPIQTYPNPLETPKIVAEQYNNHTYNNPTINYHMNNVPYPFFPCASLPYFPPILLPINSTTTFDMNLVTQQQSTQQQPTTSQDTAGRPRRDRRTRGRRKNV